MSITDIGWMTLLVIVVVNIGLMLKSIIISSLEEARLHFKISLVWAALGVIALIIQFILLCIVR